MTLVWGTDWHLDFLKSPYAAKNFAAYLMTENPNAQGLVITGDISNGKKLEGHLRELAIGWTKPIYFVLGNHSYYDSSFSDIDSMVKKLTKEVDNLHWLNEGVVKLDGHVLVGVGGWYDAYHGNSRSQVGLADWSEIKDLWPGLNNNDLLIRLIRDRAGQEADTLARLMKTACEGTEDIIVATHVAPYAEAAWHMGKLSDRDWVPWFSSASTGAVIDQFADQYPDKNFIVLCGHGHSPGIYKRRNITVYTGGARYGTPDIAGKLDLQNKKIRTRDSSGKKVNAFW